MKKDLEEKIFLAKKYFENHIHEKVSLAEVAKASFLSPFHFHRIFQSSTGLSPRVYFEKIKLERGAYLLKYTKQSMGDIAFEIGFENQESFTRSFKAKFQSSPSEFRKQKSPFGFAEDGDSKDFLNLVQNINGIEKGERVDLNFSFVYYRYMGSWSDSGRAWRQVMDWGLQKKLFHKESTLVGIWYDDPEIASVGAQRFDLGILLPKEYTNLLSVPSKMNIARVSGTYLKFPFDGPFSGLEFFYPQIYRSLLATKNIQVSNKPVIELYSKFPPFFSPNQYQTDVFIPVLHN